MVRQPDTPAGVVEESLKVFVSWSGPDSRAVAKALSEWLGLVVQHVEPWMSDAEIKSGARWNDTLARSLDEIDFGLVCVTQNNQNSPWLMFESGALAKRLETARLVPLCIDLKPAEITSPLQAFQGRSLNREGVRQLILELSELAPRPRKSGEIDRLFEAMWPSLEVRIDEAKALTTASPRRPARPQEDMLAELVERIRSLEYGIQRGEPSPVLIELMDRIRRIERGIEETLRYDVRLRDEMMQRLSHAATGVDQLLDLNSRIAARMEQLSPAKRPK